MGRRASSEVFGNNVTADHVSANDGIYDIVVTAVDDQDATELLYPQPAVQTTVSNIAPEISVTHLESGLTVVSTGGEPDAYQQLEVNEGSLISLRLVASDPGDDEITWTIDWADGSDIESVTGRQLLVPHRYTDDFGTRDLLVTVNDGSAPRSFDIPIEVLDVAPTATLVASTTQLSEGGTVSLTIGTPQDPGVDDVISRYLINWGEGGVDDFEEVTFPTATHPYTDGDAVHSIRVRLEDESGQQFELDETIELFVANVSPTLLIDGAARVTEGSVYQLTLGLAEDPGDDTVTIYRVTWEEGGRRGYSPEDPGGSRVVTHTYAGSGPRTISVEMDGRGRHLCRRYQEPAGQRDSRRCGDTVNVE